MDLLTFVPNINVFRQALKDDENQQFVYLTEDNEVKLLIPSVPVKTNGIKTLTLLRCNLAQKEFLTSIPALEIIGEYQGGEDYLFYDDVPNRAKYAEVYDQTPVEMDDGEGGTTTYTPPKMIGVFL